MIASSSPNSLLKRIVKILIIFLYWCLPPCCLIWHCCFNFTRASNSCSVQWLKICGHSLAFMTGIFSAIFPLLHLKSFRRMSRILRKFIRAIGGMLDKPPFINLASSFSGLNCFNKMRYTNAKASE